MLKVAAEFGYLPQDSETVTLLCNTDWEATALGHPSTWPEALRLQLNICFESAFPFAVWWGPDLIQFYNDAYRPILGTTKHPAAFGGPAVETWRDVWQTVGPMVSQVVEQGVAVKGDDMPLVLERNGYPELCHFTFSYSPIRNIGGKIDGMFTAAVETTERVRTERRQAFLFTLQERLHALAEPREIMFATAEMLGTYLDVDRCGYAEIDDTGQFFDVLRDWTKGDMESLAGHHNLDNFGLAYIAELRQGRSAVFDDAYTSPLTQDEVAKVTFPAVRTRAAISVPLVKGGRLAATLYKTQIEPRQWTEQEKQLARDVAERTWAAVERARAELKKVRVEEELKEKDQRKDEFLAMLAHELRNPLAPIAAAAQVLQLAKLDDTRMFQTSQLISRQVKHMTRLVDDLLDVSRVTRGLVELDRRPIDIQDIVANAVEQAMPLIRMRWHNFALHLPPDTIMVIGDEKRLIQVIANLLNNAAKYTQEGGNIMLKVDVHATQAVIDVEDNGIGMAPSLVARAFELFSQAERSSDRSSGGLGIGLALVRSLTELHQGTVACESAGLGKGSRFTVCLPRLVDTSNQDSKDKTRIQMPEETNSLKILVVDDNVDAASMLAMLLEVSGHKVFVEHASRRALERAKQEHPQVCVLDIGLPEIDGFELARRLRAQPETAHSILIAATGYGQEQDRLQALSAGFNHHFVKPIDISKLAELLAEIAAMVFADSGQSEEGLRA